MQLPARLLFPLWLLCLAFSTRAQTISLTVDNQALEKVMASIEQQSGHRFIYSSEMMALSKPVTASFRNETLARALEICFKDQPLTYTLNDKHIVLQVKKPKAAAEEKRVFTGQVVDEKGEGLPGISVLIKGTSKGTTTDAQGQFLLDDVPASFRLEVSGVSIETREIAITNTSFLKIETTQKLGELDQTVVIAYGSAKKRYLVESVSKVKGEELAKQQVSNPFVALTGKVPGLEILQISGVPRGGVRVRIRGRNSIDNGTEPLFVVDGVPFPATPISESLSSASVVASPLDNLNSADIESIEVLKDAAATAIYGSRGANGVILITTKKGKGSGINGDVNFYSGFGKITRTVPFLNTQQYLSMRREAFANDNAIPTSSNAPDLKIWDTTRYTDWQKLLIGNTMSIIDLNGSLSAGTDLTRLLIRAGYRKETSVYAGDFYSEKLSAMTNFNHRSEDNKFNISASLNFTQNRSVLPSQDLTTYTKLAPNAPEVFTPDGKLNWANSTWTNPWSSILQNYSGRAESWQTSMSLGYKISKSLEFRVNGGYTMFINFDRNRMPFSSFNPSSSPVARASFARKEIRIGILEPQLEAAKRLNDVHGLSLLVGSSIQSSDQSGIIQQGSGYSSDDLLGSIFAASVISTSVQTESKYRYAALFSRFQYDYRKKYLISLSARRDGSSRFGPANRYSNFASAGVGWIISDENWLKRQEWIEFAKVRLSYGVTGNDQIGDYKYLDVYKPSSYTYLNTTTYVPAQLFSPSYSWEKVRKFESGIELSLFKGRISSTVNYFRNVSANQLISYSLPYTTGFSGVMMNIPAKISNSGWEFVLNGEILSSRNLRLSAGINLSLPKNRLETFENFEFSTYVQTYQLGYPLNISKVYQYKGVDPSTGIYQFTDFNADGKITTTADKQSIVPQVTEFYGSFDTRLDVGKIEVSLNFYFVRRPFQSYSRVYQRPGNMENQPTWVLDRWQKPGDITNIQKYSATSSIVNTGYTNFNQSDGQFSDASYIRLRNVTVAYRLSKIRIFVSGQNVAIWTRFKGLDPETGTTLPPVCTFTGGFQLSL